MSIKCSTWREKKKHHLSSDQNPGWLDYVGDYTTQLYRDYNKALSGSLLNSEYNGMS